MLKNKVLQNVIWLVLDRLMLLLLSLVVTIRIANHYGSSVYGLYEYALSIITILVMLTALIDSRVVKKRYEINSDHSNIIFNTTIGKIFLLLFSSLIGIVLIFVLDGSSKFRLIFLLLLVNNFFLNIGFGLQNYFEYNLSSKNVVIAANISGIFGAILQLIAINFDSDIVVIVLIMILSSFIRVLILFLQFKSKFNISIIGKVNTSLIRSMFQESLPLAIAATASIIYKRIDQVMIGSMLSPESVGVYSISVRMISFAVIIITPIQVSLFPKMISWYNENKVKYYQMYLKVSSLSTWIFFMLIVAVFTIGKSIFNLLFISDFDQSYSIFQVQVFGTFFMYNALLRSSHYTIIGKTKIMTTTQVIAMLINVSLNYVFIMRFGVIGAAYATLIAQGLSLLVLDLLYDDGRTVFLNQIRSINPVYAIRLIFDQRK